MIKALWADRTPLRRSALALACLKRGSSLVMVYWCMVCSVSALYANYKTISKAYGCWDYINQTSFI